MDLDSLNREELLNLIKRFYIKCIKDIEHFKAGLWYESYADESGQYLLWIDDNGYSRYFDLCEFFPPEGELKYEEYFENFIIF